MEDLLVKTCIITGFGINADIELKTAFELAGSEAERIHINDLIKKPEILKTFHIIGFPGGFSYGDHLGSGKVFGTLFKKNLKNELDSFVESGRIVIGICNGFQVLVKMGIAPNLNLKWEPEVSLIHNDSGKFEDRWVKLKLNSNSKCIWTKGITELDAPVRHGEGKFITDSESVLNTLEKENLVVFRYSAESGDVNYPDNPNGSVNNIAGICDRSGRIFGLMPHPEAFLYPENHPTGNFITTGLEIFKNGVNYIKNNT
jgi:phosphoribosylformylglycinamidine synthase subunit PurQ / glutaminase